MRRCVLIALALGSSWIVAVLFSTKVVRDWYSQVS